MAARLAFFALHLAPDLALGGCCGDGAQAQPRRTTAADDKADGRYFEKRDMRPLFVDELAVHPDMHGRGVGSFVLEQLHHLARVHGLNHLVLEVAENNQRALDWYKNRAFKKLDAAIFMACPVDLEPELLPPRKLPPARDEAQVSEPSTADPSGE